MRKTECKTSEQIRDSRDFREKVLFKNLIDALSAYVAFHEMDIKGKPHKAQKKGRQ